MRSIPSGRAPHRRARSDASAPETTPRVLLVDDQPDLLETMAEWLRHSGYRTETAASVQEAMTHVRRATFDVAVTDLQMPGGDGLELLGLLKAHDPALEVVFLSGRGTMQDAIEALREGRAFDFLQKPLREMSSLNRTIDRAFAHRCARELTHKQAPGVLPGHVEPLSSRETEIVALLAQGFDNREIAERLVLSEKTVKNHLTRIYEKLKVGNRTQAVVLCQRYRII